MFFSSHLVRSITKTTTAPTNKSITRGKYGHCVWRCTTYMCDEKFYNQADARGGGGGGGRGLVFTEGQNRNYDSARFTKACNIHFANVPQTARD